MKPWGLYFIQIFKLKTANTCYNAFLLTAPLALRVKRLVWDPVSLIGHVCGSLPVG